MQASYYELMPLRAVTLTKEKHNVKKHLVAAGIATAVGITGLTGISIANAATSANTTNPVSSLVDEIATKFNLNKSDVQAVFDSHRTEMQTQRETQVKDKLAQLVKDGKLTQDQSDKILAKHDEIQKARDAARASGTTKTRAEMRTEMQAKRTELETWAKDNGIDTQYLRFVLGGPGFGHGGMGMMHDADADDATPAQ
jgi:polyhydroxyalkanoate synthesis regulator phasin